MYFSTWKRFGRGCFIMKEKQNKKRDYRSASNVVIRLVKDMRGISGWLITALSISLLSVILAMVAPSLLGSLTDRVYNLINKGIQIDKFAFGKEVIGVDGVVTI